MRQPNVLVIQDISASCRISMNVAVPVLSVLNNAVSVLPTALLSTHTGVVFSSYSYLDLTNEWPAILMEWKKLQIQFDGIVVGYLGSKEQIQLVQSIKKEFLKEGGLFIVDPVMGDHGTLYAGFDEEYVSQMRGLCQEVSVLIPNLTEASYLLEMPYHEGPHSKDYIEQILTKLTELTKKQVILTGVSYQPGEIGAASMAYGDEESRSETGPRYPGHYEGTGDLFSSVVAGFLFQKRSLNEALQVAVRYTHKVIERTVNNQTDFRFGVQFETDLPYLIQALYTSKESE